MHNILTPSKNFALILPDTNQRLEIVHYLKKCENDK